MAALADYAEDLVLKYLLTDDNTITRPTSWYVALHDDDPTDDGSQNELSGDGYARQVVEFDAPSNGATENKDQIVFGPAEGSGWGTVTHVSIWDAEEGGNCLFQGALSAPVAIGAGDSLVFAAGNLDISID